MKDKRTLSQNNALHLYFEMIANELNNAGLEVKKTLPQIDIPWSKELVKEGIWKPIQLAQLQKNKTSKLNKKEVNEVQEVVNRWLSELGISVNFPSIEEIILKTR